MTRSFLLFILLSLSADAGAQLLPGLVFRSGFESPPVVDYPSAQGDYQVDFAFLPPVPILDPMQPAMAAIDEFLDDPNIALLRIMSILADPNYAEEGPFQVFAGNDVRQLSVTVFTCGLV